MKKTKTWIITCIYLQLLFICFGSPCGNPVTNAVHDINKLVGNLPNDYIMHLKNISRDSLAKHCWLYVMVFEVSERLGELSSKLANTSENYFILHNLSLIFREIRNCVKLTEKKDFIDQYFEILDVEEMTVVPKLFFDSVTQTISVFTEINNTNFDACVVPTSDPSGVDPVTKGSVQFAPSKLKNNSFLGHPDIEHGSHSNLPWTSIASIAIACMTAGFLLGVLCWKMKHQRCATADEAANIHADQKEANELNNMLQQTAKEVSII